MEFWRMPLDAVKHELVVGEVKILEYRCKGCKYCIDFCPKGLLAESKEFNAKGYHYPYMKEGAVCSNCNFCETVCPEFAIHVSEKGRKVLVESDVQIGSDTGERKWRRRREKQ